MDGIQIDCLYCGKVSTFIISDNLDLKNLKCNTCNETKLLKKSKVSFLKALKSNKPEEEKSIKDKPVEILFNENLNQTVDSGDGDGYFPDLYDDFFNYSQ